MGQEPSKPQPGKTLRVIGAGLPRTGTASFSEALRILLDGPVYHGGTQNTLGAEKNVRGWMRVLRRTPFRSEADRKQVKQTLRDLLDGYVAVTDAPACCFAPELLELYPDAKVVVTVRNADKWAESIDKLSKTSLQGFLRFALFWLPSLRYFPDYIDLLNGGRWAECHGPPNPGETYIHGRYVWDRHMANLERTVPKEKLVYFDVRDGWEPLCRALELPVPQGVEFPQINDGEATDKFAKEHIAKGLRRWAAVGGLTAVALASAFWYWRRAMI